MELKDVTIRGWAREHDRFNRTFMELKGGIPGQSAGFYPVLIVPLWN